MPPAADTFKICIATDSHLGYMEKDPVRCDDSFAAFEEVLRHANSSEADLVLLGGDLFHDNKPSRSVLWKTMDVLKRHALGDRAVAFDVLSDHKDDFAAGLANHLSPNHAVALPVFSIHGNHDDPTRDGPNQPPLAALDLLSAASLVNYFGRNNMSEDIQVSPVLLRKGRTNIALYGLGNMRDERLNRIWQKQKLKVRVVGDAPRRRRPPPRCRPPA